MILSRYILKDIFAHTISISVIFLTVILSSRSIQYLEQASRGELSPELVFWIILYRLPEFVELILPFGFFLGIILVLGRLYSNSEMIIMQQSGISNFRLTSLIFGLGIIFATFISFLSLWVSPLSDKNVQELLSKKTFIDDFKSIQPGIFHKLNDNLIIFAKEKESEELENVFIKFSDNFVFNSYSFLSAKKARLNQESRDTFTLADGFIFSDDKKGFSKISFDELIIDMEYGLHGIDVSKSDFKVVSESYLGWGLSIPLLCLISALIAIPLSKSGPRKGRYIKILPGIFIFISYLALLLVAKGWVESNQISNILGFLPIHILFLLVAIFLFFRSSKVEE